MDDTRALATAVAGLLSLAQIAAHDGNTFLHDALRDAAMHIYTTMLPQPGHVIVSVPVYDN